MSYLVPESTLFYVHPAGSHTYVQDYECVRMWNHGRKIQNSTSKDKDVFSKDQELFRKDNGLLGKEQELFLVGSNKEVFRQKSVTSVTASLNLLINRNLQVWRIVWQIGDGLFICHNIQIKRYSANQSLEARLKSSQQTVSNYIPKSQAYSGIESSTGWNSLFHQYGIIYSTVRNYLFQPDKTICSALMEQVIPLRKAICS